MADIQHNTLFSVLIAFKSYPEGQKPSKTQDAENKVWEEMRALAASLSGNRQVTMFEIKASRHTT